MIFSEKDGKIKFLYLHFTAKIVPWPVWGKRQFISWPLILSHDSRGQQNTIVFWNRSSSLLMVCGKLIHCTLSCTTMVMRITSLLSIDDMHTWLGSIYCCSHTRDWFSLMFQFSFVLHIPIANRQPVWCLLSVGGAFCTNGDLIMIVHRPLFQRLITNDEHSSQQNFASFFSVLFVWIVG